MWDTDGKGRCMKKDGGWQKLKGEITDEIYKFTWKDVLITLGILLTAIPDTVHFTPSPHLQTEPPPLLPDRRAQAQSGSRFGRRLL